MKNGYRNAATVMGLLVFSWITVLCAPARGLVGRHDRKDEALLALGQRFPATGRIDPDGSCTLVAPTWIVTAGHVAHQIRPGVHSVYFGTKKYTVKRVVMHPDCKPSGHRPPEVDLALIELADPVKDVTPAALYRKNDETGKSIIVAGYGDLGDGTSRPRFTDGKLRAATNVIDSVRPARILFDFSKPPAGTDLEGVSGPGDSGGPAFVEIDGRPLLIGVSSAAMNGKPGRYGVTEVYTRISAFAPWIDGMIK